MNGETEAPKIMMYGKALENVSNFKYLGATLSDDATSKKNLYKICNGNISNGEIRKDLEEQRNCF